VCLECDGSAGKRIVFLVICRTTESRSFLRMWPAKGLSMMCCVVSLGRLCAVDS
jgi:hypothetical protein